MQELNHHPKGKIETESSYLNANEMKRPQPAERDTSYLKAAFPSQKRNVPFLKQQLLQRNVMIPFSSWGSVTPLIRPWCAANPLPAKLLLNFLFFRTSKLEQRVTLHHRI